VSGNGVKGLSFISSGLQLWMGKKSRQQILWLAYVFSFVVIIDFDRHLVNLGPPAVKPAYVAACLIWYVVFYAQQHICYTYMLSLVRLSVCSSDRCIIEKRLKLGLWNFHHPSSFYGVIFIQKFLGVPPRRGEGRGGQTRPVKSYAASCNMY